MRKKAIVVGLGETGMPLWQVLDAAYPGEILGYDPKKEGFDKRPTELADILHVCLPWGPNFKELVWEYQGGHLPALTVIHSTVPVGTTKQFENAVHSPILGRHGRMREDIQTYTKWIGGPLAEKAASFFEKAHLRCRTVETADETELLKLMCLAKYGVSIAFAFYQQKLCDEIGVPFEHVMDWDANYNEGVYPSKKRPLIEPDSSGKIGGHCVIPGTRILEEMCSNDMLKEVLRHG